MGRIAFGANRYHLGRHGRGTHGIWQLVCSIVCRLHWASTNFQNLLDERALLLLFLSIMPGVY